jgi:acetyltransferase-like isoleucine patch superfamily enzyme
MNWRVKLKVLLSIRNRFKETRGTAAPVSLRSFFLQYILGFNKTAYWPMHHSSTVSGSHFIEIGEGTAPGLSHGCYLFACKGGEIKIGEYSIVAPNVIIAGYNHSLLDYREIDARGKVSIGPYSWLGANSVVLPGVTLGPHTVVGAGAVVTRSFPEGYAVLAGNPAKVISTINKDDCIDFQNSYAYIGYLKRGEFEKHRNNLIVQG